MDADVGDGDLGIGASRAANKALKILNNLDFENNLKNSILKLSDVFSDGFGGSSGPLWGAFFSTGASQLNSSKLDEIDVSQLINAYRAGLEAMMDIGGADKGNRTMVDALIFG